MLPPARRVVIVNVIDEYGEKFVMNIEDKAFRLAMHDYSFKTPEFFCLFAIDILNTLKGEQYGKMWCEFKMAFCKQYQKGLIFSTRFGADFFEETLNYLNSKDFLKAFPGQELGVYDKNFNEWLKINRI